MKEKGSRDEVRQSILAEIENWKKNPPERLTWHAFLNNFHTYLPSKQFEGRGGSYMANLALKIGVFDVVMHNLEMSDEEKRHHSLLYLSQTPREFFGAIYDTVNMTPGISVDKLIKLQSAHEKHRHICLSHNMSPEEEAHEFRKIEKSGKKLHEIYEYALPIYVELRVRGYSNYDLTA